MLKRCLKKRKKEYEIVVPKSVNDFIKKQQKKDRSFYLEITKKLIKIKKNPYKGKSLSNEYKNHFRERIRNFRIIYIIIDKEIRILDIRNRDDVYK